MERSTKQAHTKNRWLGRLWILLLCVLVLTAGLPVTQSAKAAAALWTKVPADTLPMSNFLQTVRYGGGEWLAAGQSATVVVSDDGEEWSDVAISGAFNEWSDAVHDGSHWLLVGSDGKIFKSTGKKAASGWSQLNSGTNEYLSSIAYDGSGTYVVVGDAGVILTSNDGSTWTDESSPAGTSETLFSVAYSNNLFVTVSSAGKIYTSPDGSTWTERKSAFAPLFSVQYGNGKFVAVGSGIICVSSDGGFSWQVEQPSGAPDLYAVAYGSAKYVAVGASGELRTSVDAENWSDEEDSTTSDDLYSIGYSAELRQFVSVGGNASAVALTQEEPSEKLNKLTLSTGMPSPNFSPDVIAYTANVPDTATTMTLTASAQERKATIKLQENGNTTTLTSGNPSGNIAIGVGSTTVAVEVTSSTGVSKTYTITVNRQEPNEAPTALTLSNYKIEENKPVKTEIGTLTATDSNAGETFTYSLTAGDTGSFVIEGNQLKSNEIFDYERKNNYSLTISVKDSRNAFFSHTFSIEVVDVNEPPVVTNNSKTALENNPITFSDSDFTSFYVDPELIPLNKIQITKLPDNGALTLDGNSVVLNQEIPATEVTKLVYTPTAKWSGTDSFTWKGSDGAVYSTQAAEYSLIITDVNGLPIVKDIAKSGLEDNPIPFTGQEFHDAFEDEDAGDSLVQIQVSSLPAFGSLQVTGVPVTVNQVIPAAMLLNLSYVPQPGWNGTDSFTWKGYDGKDYSSSTANVTITISHVNRAPVVSDASKSGPEDTSLPFAKSDFTYQDNDGNQMTELKVESLPSHGTLALDLTPVAAGQVIPTSDLSKLNFTPDPDWYGTTDFQWNATDGQLYATSPAQMTLTITAVNDAPVAQNGTLRVTQNQSKQGTVTASDLEGDPLTYQMVSPPAKGTVSMDPATGEYTYTPNRNATGSDSFTYKANDGTLDSNTATISVTITAVVVPPTPVYGPSISDIKDQTIVQGGQTEKLDFTVTDPDNDPRTLVVTATSDNQDLVPDENIELAGSGTNRTIQVTSLAGKHDTATIFVTVSDGRSSASDSFTVSVSQMNHPPRALNGFLLAEKQETVKGKLLATDEDNDPLTFILVKQPTKGKVTLTNEQTGTYTYTPNKGSTSTSDDSFTFKVTDGTSYSNVATVTISRKISSDATLQELLVSDGKLAPDFSSKRTSYKLQVKNDVTSLTLTPTAAHASAQIRVNGEEVESGSDSSAIDLKLGINQVEIVVTAQNGTTKKTYKLEVEREYPRITDIQLSKHSLKLTEGDDPVDLAVRIKPAQEIGNQLVWKSSRTSVATVDATGRVTPRKKGTATITVSSLDGKAKDKVTVTVEEGKLLYLSTDDVMYVMQPGDTESIKIYAHYKQGTKQDVTDEVRWSTKDRKVATAAKGEITAKDAGTTLLTSSFNGASLSIRVHVYEEPWVDDRDVEVTLEQAEVSGGHELHISGKLPAKERVSVKVQIGKKQYSAEVDREDNTFVLTHEFAEKDELPEQVQLIIKPSSSKKEEQVIILPIQLFDASSLQIKELKSQKDKKKSYSLTGKLYDETQVRAVELVEEDEVVATATIKRGKLEIPSFSYDGEDLILRATSYTGFTQEWKVEIKE
ncbi:Ig-like domain-containing protein [Brevibacillus nitrificans]|uniref:Ig-like domain-containing protein n=1 Tax=Brevibacillus nitrificans TaxID=651560 RepID=UPI00285E18AB|nr:Ig-like domain-containing protein [Brevibacillus nitrificans]MDR7316997.1 VCBS repeat-containing protein [Brevibacillus nitrificans]